MHEPGESVATGSRPAKVLVACLLGMAAVVPLLPTYFGPSDLRTQLLTRSISVALICVAALRLVTALPDATRGIAHWRIGPWYLLWSTVSFGLASLTWLEPQIGSASRIAVPSVVGALMVVAVAQIAWTTGYVLGPPRLVAAVVSGSLAGLLRGTGTTVRIGPALPWVLYAIGTVARLATVRFTGSFGYVGAAATLLSTPLPLGQLLNMVSMLAIFAIAAAAYQLFSRPSTGRLISLLLLVGIEATVGALGGGKESFVLSMLAVLIPYGALRGRLPLKVILIGAFLFLWLVVPFNTSYRQVVRSERSVLTPSAAVAAAPQVLSQVARPNSIQTVLVDSAYTLLRRIREIDSVAIIRQRTPGIIPYRSPADYVTAPVLGVVPRVLWPDKPVLAAGYQFSQEYYQLPSSVYTSTAITPPGDLYRHGGWLPLVFGMALIGVACRQFDKAFRAEDDFRAICFLLVFIPMVVKAELDVFSLLASLPSAIVTAVIGAHLICRLPARSPGVPAGPPAAGPVRRQSVGTQA